jgi:hypothetical protein
MGFSATGHPLTPPVLDGALRNLCAIAVKRVAKAVLISSVPPLMVKTDNNPGGTPIEVFDGFRNFCLVGFREGLNPFIMGFSATGHPLTPPVLDGALQ